MKNVLNKLNELIDDGKEYPEAEFEVCQQYKLNDKQIENLRNLYDEQE